MPVSITPVSVPASAAVALGSGLPAGPYYALLSGGSATTNGIYVGVGTAATTTGLYVPGGQPVAFNGFAGGTAAALWAIAGSGTVTAVLMVSTPR